MKDVLLIHKDIFILSNIIYKALYEAYLKLNEIRNYL